MSLRIYLTILRSGIYLSFLSVFLVFSNLLFPYITSKQIFFNILTELLMVFWLALVIKYPEARPKKSYITFGLAAFFAALLVSSWFGVDFNMSFWGNIERMLGWFHVIHFFLFYLIIITVFREWRDWRNLFMVSVMASVLVSFYALVKTPISTIGNTAYVSGYAIFNIFFVLILFFRRGRDGDKTANRLTGALYLIAVFIMLAVMSATHTRGAYIGLAVGFLLFLILFAAASPSRKVKIYSLGGLALAAAAVILAFSFPRSSMVTNSSILRTVTQISTQAVTFQTRLISWKSALKDFPNHLLLGTGYGNYAVTFDKYFDPSFYNYTTAETYFDRAHNNLVDLASTSGLFGLMTYLSIFAAAGYHLAKARKQNKISSIEFSLLVSLFAAYFIQNLVVFDSLVTYISLMITLAYIYWQANGEPEAASEEAGASSALTNQELAALAAAGLSLFLIIYQYNLKPFLMLDSTIAGQIAFARGDAAAGFAAYKKAMSYETPLDRDSRKSLINLVNSNPAVFSKPDKKTGEENLNFTVKLAEANVKHNPGDSMMQMQLALTYNTAAMFYADNPGRFTFYSDQALAAIGRSIKASPGRVTIYFSKAQIYLTRNDKDNAIKTLAYAYSLNEKFTESVCYLAKVRLWFQDQAKGFANMDKCLDLGGAGSLMPVELVKISLDHYLKNKDQARSLALYQRWSVLEPNDAKIWINLALLYLENKDKVQAAAAAKKAAELDTSLKSAVEEFIKKIQ